MVALSVSISWSYFIALFLLKRITKYEPSGQRFGSPRKTKLTDYLQWGGEDIRFIYWPVTCVTFTLTGPIVALTTMHCCRQNRSMACGVFVINGSLKNSINKLVPNKPIVVVNGLSALSSKTHSYFLNHT